MIGQVFLAVDRSGTSTNNNVYMLASVQPTGFSTGSDVMFVRSTDGGQTFSAPKRVNDDPINHSKWHWFGTLSVAPNGRIDSVWLDTRNAANNTDSQLFYSYSTDAGNTWSPNVAVSNPFNPFLGYPQSEQDGRLHDNRFGQYRRRCRVCRNVQSRRRRLLRSRRSRDSTDADTFAHDLHRIAVHPTPTPTRHCHGYTTPHLHQRRHYDANTNSKSDAGPGGAGLNLSTRMLVQTGDNVGIGGFIITGSAPKQVRRARHWTFVVQLRCSQSTG